VLLGSLRARVVRARRAGAAEASVGAVWGIVHRHVATGRAQQLPRSAPVLSFMALAPAIGAREAVREITAEHELMREEASPRRAPTAGAR
jgi:hypothetical protein